ncbi:hypothetical protein C9J01_27440 [Photobacterium rosenbergii]|uniref:VCBS repeat-containing protein n=1 Tax=Photobacterium rosenbergii TaxID=294936 RepID=A0A2T3MZ91_9GAMM|nr:VCBS repeat-containing protein [Photobacterium rosenbergii]PSW05290.1 hypothetical protein C9J01_27440 [Photobacterium rosenbergii]
MDIKTKRWLAVPMLSAALMACGEGSNKANKDAEVADDKLVVNTQFAATYLQTIEKAQPTPVAFKASQQTQKVMQASQSKSYDGKLQVTNILSGEQQEFDWPMTQKVDSEGNVETISHRALTLKPGSYDFLLMATAKDAKKSQYVAEALGEEIVDGETPEINFVLKPNLGDIISDFDEIQYASTLIFSWPAEELVSLSNPQFGLSLNGSDETVYTINKETGIAEALIFVEPGEHTLAMRLYDGDLMVGKNQDEKNTINFSEGEDAKMDVIPLQADVELDLGELKDQGTFTFIVPKEVVTEVGSADQLALIVRLGGNGAPLQEKQLDVYDDNGTYKASALFETGGQDAVSAYLAFHEMSEAASQFDGAPFAKCDTSINVVLNQTLGCKLELKRESIISGRVLGTLMLSVLDQYSQPAIGAKVYVDNDLVGLTGDQYSTGSIKLHLVAGEHEIKAVQEQWTADKNVEVQPLSVMNELLRLERNKELGDGHFKLVQEIKLPEWNDHAALADANGDGFADYWSVSTDSKSINILFNDGKGQFNGVFKAIPLNYQAKEIIIGDINGNGWEDFVALSGMQEDEGLNYHQVYFNDGKGGFTAGQKFAVVKSDSTTSGLGQLVDVNNNGKLDLVVKQSRYGLNILLNNGDGEFSSTEQLLKTSHGDQFVVVDINNNGYKDIIAEDIFINDGGAVFEHLSSSPGGSNGQIKVAGDFNGDGYVDLFVGKSSGDIKNALYFNDGQGNFVLSQQDFGRNTRAAVTADMNSNGALDIVIATSVVGTNQLHQYINDGTGQFELSVIDESRSSDILLADDLDGDYDVDLVSSWTNDAHIYLNQPATH